MMLQQLVDEIPVINGIVAYSLFQMPENQEKRLQIINKILDRNGELHFALENLKISNNSEMSGIVEYSNEYYDNLLINDKLITSGNDYNFGMVSINDTMNVQTIVDGKTNNYSLCEAFF